jgi:hypothetical protein
LIPVIASVLSSFDQCALIRSPQPLAGSISAAAAGGEIRVPPQRGFGNSPLRVVIGIGQAKRLANSRRVHSGVMCVKMTTAPCELDHYID